ncbi:MAG: Gfo/Idh/MocA family protein [Gemmataceae bacterium]
MLNLAMLGMWHTHAHGIVKQVAAHPDEFSLVACYDADPKVVAERTKAWEPLLKKINVVKSAEALVAEQVDGIVVEGRVHDNLKSARLCLEAGKHVLLEKPAGTDLTEFRRLLDLARQKKRHVQMIYLFRYMSAVQEMFKRARNDDLGELYYFRARLPKQFEDYDRFVEELKPYKGGMFFEMAGHIIDMMVKVMGEPKGVTPFLGHHHTDGPENYIDNGVAVFEYEHGYGLIEVPALEVVPAQRRIEAFGINGACIIPHLGSGHLKNRNVQVFEYCKGGAKEWQFLELPAATLQLADLREFAQVIAGKKQPDFSMAHDLIVQEYLLKASGMA